MREEIATRNLDQEAIERREHLASTLDELSASLTPGRMLDEILSYAKGGGGNFLMGLGKSAATNPVPTLLIGAGCAMLLSGRSGLPFLEGRGRAKQETARTEYDRSVRTRGGSEPGVISKVAGAVSGAASSVAHKVAHAAGSVAGATADLGGRVVETAARATDKFTETTSAAGESIASRAQAYTEEMTETAQTTATSAQRKATLLGRELNGKAAHLFNEYPLVVAAGGLLAGAALAAFLPRTRVEDRYLGATSDSLKDSFVSGAIDGVERVATAAQNVAQTVSAKAGEEDILGSARESVDSLSRKFSTTLKAGQDAIDRELRTKH